MKMKKAAIFIFLFVILLNTNSSSKADNISITFWNLDMDMDDVNNYGGIRLVIFFLPSCPACISETSVLKEIDENYNITIFALNPNIETTNQTLLDFREAYSLPDDWIMGYSTEQANSKFNLSTVPLAVILDDLGRVVAMKEGSTLYTFFEEKIEDAINHNTENYNPYFVIEPDNSDDLLKVLFIVIGVGVTTVILYFLIRAIRRGSKESAIINATKRIEGEENNT